MRLVFVLLLLITCFINDGYCDFFNDIPSKISNALSNTWTNIIDAIQRPVRTKRLGPASRKKALRAMSTSKPIILSPKNSDKVIEDISRKTGERNKFSVPLEVNPQYMTLEEFLERQKQVQLIPTKTSSTSRYYVVKFFNRPTSNDGRNNHNLPRIFEPLEFI